MKINKVGIIFKLLVVNGEGRERKALRRGETVDLSPSTLHPQKRSGCSSWGHLTFTKKSSNTLAAVPSSGAKNPDRESLTSSRNSLSFMHTRKCVLQCVFMMIGFFHLPVWFPKNRQTFKSMIWQQIREFLITKTSTHLPTPCSEEERKEKSVFLTSTL